MEYELLSKAELLKMSKEEIIEKLRDLENRYSQSLDMLVDGAYLRKHGHWIEFDYDEHGNCIQCSCCKSKFDLYSRGNYCKSYGAIMD